MDHLSNQRIYITPARASDEINSFNDIPEVMAEDSESSVICQVIYKQ